MSVRQEIRALAFVRKGQRQRVARPLLGWTNPMHAPLRLPWPSGCARRVNVVMVAQTTQSRSHDPRREGSKPSAFQGVSGAMSCAKSSARHSEHQRHALCIATSGDCDACCEAHAATCGGGVRCGKVMRCFRYVIPLEFRRTLDAILRLASSSVRTTGFGRWPCGASPLPASLLWTHRGPPARLRGASASEQGGPGTATRRSRGGNSCDGSNLLSPSSWASRTEPCRWPGPRSACTRSRRGHRPSS